MSPVLAGLTELAEVLLFLVADLLAEDPLDALRGDEDPPRLAELFDAPREAEDLADLLLEVDLDVAFLEADFLLAPFLALLFLALLFLEAPFLAPPFLEADLFAPPFLAALFLDADFLDALFLDELRLPEDEPPLFAELPRLFLDAPFLDAPFFEDLPPERFADDFLDAAFLVDFAIFNGFFSERL